jgi:glycogen debranching enzyme
MKILISLLFSLLLVVSSLPVLADEGSGEITFSGKQTDELSPGSPRLVLKNGNSLMVLDRSGMIDPRSGSPYGLYENDTRFLSRWQLSVDGKEPTLLTAFTQRGFEGNFLYGILDEVMIERDIVLLDGMNERILIRSFVDRPLKFKLAVWSDCDFKDMFEVRGMKRIKFGERLGAQQEGEKDGGLSYKWSYRGADKQIYSTSIRAGQPQPVRHAAGRLEYDVSLSPRGSQTIELRVDTSNTPEKTKAALTYSKAREESDRALAAWEKTTPAFASDWVLLNDIIAQASSDLYLLQQKTPRGPCLAAGLPWYSTAFGRDQCVTALQTLPFMPGLTCNVLKVLSAYQGKVHDPVTEEEPGKIMHELRLGDMARSKEIAFRPYYGTVDATPLWLMLFCRYWQATGDLELARSLWPNVEAALAYLEKCTASTNGFLYYGGKDGAALANQAWKDSGDSIMHSDGKLATPPIAVCEVQGYLYDAYVGCAELAGKLGHNDTAAKLSQKATDLKTKFKGTFWLPSQRIIALAMDGTGKPCDVVASNAGHLLNTGILDDEMSEAVAERLMKDDMFSGWGIRTLSTKEVRYNPLSYHDGSVWPHDNAMIIEGLARRGKMDAACKAMESLIQSAKAAGDARLPELFCGFPRADYPAPVPYAVSCVPQAWAAGAVYQMLKSILGIKLVDNQIHIVNPKLPASINHLVIDGLHSGKGTATVEFKRDASTGVVSVNSSSSEIIIGK